MKRQDIKDDSRAAFYLKARANCPLSPYTAAAAWLAAARMKARGEEAAAAWEDAKAALSRAWEEAGKVEPKRFSPAGIALRELRAAERKASAARFRSCAYVASGGDSYWGQWQESGDYFAQRPAAMFRNVTPAGEVCGHVPQGYYDNALGESFIDDSGLVIPVVAQLPGKGGRARFLAGYQLGGQDDGGITIAPRIFESEDGEDAQRDAARAADKMAESIAEESRHYDSAWRAGEQWASLKEEEARAAALALLQERRAVSGGRIPPQARDFAPAICRAIRDSVSGHWQTIQRNRAARAELAAGDNESFYFYPDKAARAAFAEGAGLAGFPS